MRRAAIFVDAGYFYAQASYSAFGSSQPRSILTGGESHLIGGLVTFAASVLPTDCEVIRTYWYDAAPNGESSRVHNVVGDLSSVKVRLGRLVNRRQKGVDTLLIRDLMVLSQEGTISHAFVVSGDEDLREAVVYAQDRGVVVWLLGINGPRGASLSQTLRREADHVSFDITAAAVDAVRHGSATAMFANESPMPQIARLVDDTLGADRQAELQSARPRIPSDIDSHLLRIASLSAPTNRTLDLVDRRRARKAFWKEFDRRRE